MKELGITKGEWIVDFNRVPNGMASLNEQISIRTDEWDIACAFVDITDEGDEEKANAMLIADAGNTAQKCGLQPSELLQQRDELREALAEMVWQFGYRSTYEGRESLHTGGLSALESAFDALGLSDPIALLDFEAAIKTTER